MRGLGSRNKSMENKDLRQPGRMGKPVTLFSLSHGGDWYPNRFIASYARQQEFKREGAHTSVRLEPTGLANTGEQSHGRS